MAKVIVDLDELKKFVEDIQGDFGIVPASLEVDERGITYPSMTQHPDGRTKFVLPVYGELGGEERPCQCGSGRPWSTCGANSSECG